MCKSSIVATDVKLHYGSQKGYYLNMTREATSNRARSLQSTDVLWNEIKGNKNVL